MTLDKSPLQQTYTIKSIDVIGPLRSRLDAFGIFPGKEIIKVANAHSIAIYYASDTFIAMRKCDSKLITLN